MCEVCHDYVETRLIEADYTACVCLDHYSEEQRRSLEYELELAHNVQRALLSHHEPDIPGVELAAFSRPAQIVGGDFFDFLRFGDGSYGIVIADVAGHGMSASLYMSSLQTALRALAPIYANPAEVINKIHRLYNHNIHFTTYVTLFLGSYNPAQRSLTYINAGHNPPLWIKGNRSAAGDPIWLKPTGAAIGLVEEPAYTAETIRMNPGETLLLYTDGVTECRDGDGFYGKERLAAYCRDASDLSAFDLVQGLWQDISAYTHEEPLEDDTTIVAFKITAIV
jgi:sigma-B regulation protein RsbU (phosphoserine phosphatase)